MRLRASVFLAVFLLSSLLIAFSGVSFNASAALSGGQFMTPSEALDVFGSEIDFSYFNGADYTSSVFRYNGSVSVWGVDNSASFENDLTQYTYLRYISDSVSSVTANPNYITVDISPSYSIFDTEQIHSCIALSSSGLVSTVFQSPAWDWVVDGSSYHVENTVESSQGSGYYAGIELYSVKHTFVPFDWSSQSLSSGYSLRATFSGNSDSNGVFFLLIACPYISTSASGSNGTFPITTSQDINVNVDIDLSETNSLLEDIKDGLSSIWSGITGVFIPSQSFVEDWKSDMSDLLDDTFGRYEEVDELLEDVKDSIVGASPSSTLQLPSVSVPNTSLQFSSRSVDVVPSGWSDIVDVIKFLFDILFTTLFVNTVRQRVRTIIHGETLVEVEGVD